MDLSRRTILTSLYGFDGFHAPVHFGRPETRPICLAACRFLKKQVVLARLWYLFMTIPPKPCVNLCLIPELQRAFCGLPTKF